MKFFDIEFKDINEIKSIPLTEYNYWKKGNFYDKYYIHKLPDGSDIFQGISIECNKNNSYIIRICLIPSKIYFHYDSRRLLNLISI
jgi:hypothetical protein